MPERPTSWARFGIAFRRGRRSSVLIGPRLAAAEDALAVAFRRFAPTRRVERFPDAFRTFAVTFLPACFVPLDAGFVGFVSWPGRISLKSAALSVWRFGTG